MPRLENRKPKTTAPVFALFPIHADKCLSHLKLVSTGVLKDRVAVDFSLDFGKPVSNPATLLILPARSDLSRQLVEEAINAFVDTLRHDRMEQEIVCKQSGS